MCGDVRRWRRQARRAVRWPHRRLPFTSMPSTALDLFDCRAANQQHQHGACTGESLPPHTRSCQVLLLLHPQAVASSTEEETPLLQVALRRALKEPSRAECLAAIRAALEAGADVNARGYKGMTPLHEAADNKDAAAVKAALEELLAAGADVRAMDDSGREPLHCACLNSNDQAVAAAVQALLAGGSDAAVKDDDGWTPLRLALHKNNSQLAVALL